MKGNMADDKMFNSQNEQSQERKRIISIGICVRAETCRRQQRENTARDGQAVDNTDIQDESTKKDLLENKYDVQLIDYSSIMQGKPRFKLPNVSYDKRSYIIRWLEDVNKAMNMKNIGSLVSRNVSISQNQLDDRSQDVNYTRLSKQ